VRHSVGEHRGVAAVCFVQVHVLDVERPKNSEQAVDFERCVELVVVDAGGALAEHPRIGTKESENLSYLLHLSRD